MRFSEDDGLALRVHRAISWIERAERETNDPDTQFIFHWIAFNAAYARDLPQVRDVREHDNLSAYLGRIASLDSDSRIYNSVWNTYYEPVKSLIDNRFMYQPFWNYYNGIAGHGNWESRFLSESAMFLSALADRKAEIVLSILFDRLYVLRNQLVHGGATWNSSITRRQVGDSSTILAALVPIMIDIMMDNRHQDWGPPYYPIVS